MAKVIKGNFPALQKKKSGPATKKTPAADYQVKISLLYCAPLIWRRVQVPGSMTLARFHDVIQLCMGWSDSHLHQFIIGSKSYGPANVGDQWGAVKDLDESKFTLNELESDIRQRCIYIYDFGDSWEHAIRIESVSAPGEKPLKHPFLLAGEHACPPEDIGGPPGFEDFLEAMSAPGNENYEEMREWYGSDFDPDFFDIGQINKILKKLK